MAGSPKGPSAGSNMLVLRALIMELEGLPGGEIVARELETGVPIIYRLKRGVAMAERRELAA